MTFRLSALAAVFALAALAGCDSNGSTNALRDLDGTYTVAELIFDPVAAGLENADAATRLDADATRFEIFAGSESARFIVSRDRIRTELTFDATATRGRATFTSRTGTATDAQFAALLLPRQFTLTFDPESPRTLTGSIPLQNVNLEAFDATQYQGLRAVSGTLRIRLDRAAR